MIDTNKATSPWNITIPDIAVRPIPATPIISKRMSDEDFANFTLGVEEMLEDCADANSNERLVNVITACIGAGFTTAGAIIATSMTFGFSRGHVGAVLSGSTAGKSKVPNWRRDAEKQYSLAS
ncbi:hypothetical protein E5673_01205 [Sphingomonas sp. PAMC26645]|uniref:hypothetical protein n=1 Tax=Sphingomonas sp. PAMC26645 TaxID=2565555 RepID=UPI00109E2C60|nr:hypothetical protein [Sphingomonas sp. PAMC26645]QCB41013.1 hypothetical protein E5673_01205 [Sphingomonas sp. PAMC26645]